MEKGAVAGPVAVALAGLDGDENAERPADDREQAICAYPGEHYEWWRTNFSSPRAHFRPGAFGENLCLAGLTETDVCIGDVYRVGTVELAVTKPRGPCWKVAVRHGIPELASIMRQTLRTGWYLAVLQGGVLQAGDELELVNRGSPAVTVHVAAEAMYLRRDDLDLARHVLAGRGLAGNWRRVLEARVAGHPEPPL
jgi:MOSC domain-containing protein YiiM